MPQHNLPMMGMMGPITAVNNETNQITSSTFMGASVKFPYYINGYFELIPQKAPDDARKIAYCKRPGASQAIPNLAVSGSYNGYKIQGVISSLDRTKLLFYLNNTVQNRTAYFDGSVISFSAGNAPAAAGNWTLTGPVVWSTLDGISYGANVYYAVTDFTKGAVVNDTGTWTEITDADFTGLTKVTNFVGLDGYLFIGTSNNRIYNSDLNAATSWTSTSFLTVADSPGNLLWLGRINNYLVAFKQYSLEFYEDTGNPAPGSPLTVQKSLKKNIGLASKSSVQYVSDGILFLGQTDKTILGVYKLKYNTLDLEKVSDYFVDSALNLTNTYTTATTYSVDTVGNSTARGESQIITFWGKEFYLLSVTGMSGATKRTYVYDVHLKIWTTWDTWFASSGVSTTGVFDLTQAVPFSSSGLSYCIMVNNYIGSTNGTQPFFVGFDLTNFGSTCQDSTNVVLRAYPFVWVGDIIDFGTRKRKFLDSLELLIEPNELQSGLSTFTLYYRDTNFNDSVTTGTTRTIDYNENGSTRAIVRRLGSFRKRQFGILSTTLTPMRILGIQCQYNIGETDQEG